MTTNMFMKGVTIFLSFYVQFHNVFGDRDSKLDSRIVGGTATTIGEFPYQVSVMYIDTHFCGGSLIHQLYVLTAAHCTDNFKPEYLLVRAGSTYLDQGGQVRQVTQIYQHSSYNVINDVSHDSDIAVLKISTSFDVPNVLIIHLPQENDSVLEGQLGIATGWGKLSETGALPMELQKVDLPIISDTLCNSSSMYNGYITENMLCAGYSQGGKDTCLGDSGGPFVLNGVVIGITSWGNGCARGYQPGVYTRVSKFVTYINKIIYQ